jgi:serine/threonine-protein kinase
LDTFDIGDVILDKYAVTRVLGKGGMGRVLAAHDRTLDRPVAIKFLLPALRDRPDSVSRFEREARTAARIDNAHVARVHSVEKVDGVPFIVMEYLSGRDLAAVLGERGQLPIAEAVDLLLQACEAVAEAHALGIVHRDLKPGNLFLTKTTQGAPILKVLDFGISKTDADDVALTGAAAMLGSPIYMSPEQFESARSVDGRSDVWSLGVVLYEMLTGVPPFTGATIPNVWASIRRGSYAKLSDHRQDVPRALEQLLAATLEVDRAKRIPTVNAFAAKLAPFGTDDARASYVRIQRITPPAASAPTPGTRPADVDWPVGTGDDTKDTASALAQSRAAAPPAPPPSRSRAGWAVGLAAGAAVLLLGVVAPRLASGPKARGPAAVPSIPLDVSEAACRKGDPAACNRAGAQYATGEGVAKDPSKAFGLYTRACDRKLALACVNVGAMLFDGEGVLKDEATAVHLFFQGCEGGAPAGCVNVSEAYATGRGVPKDPAQSVAFAERACAGGAGAGCVRVATARLTGTGVTKDVKGGLTQLDALCRQGEELACQKIISLYAKGLGTDIPAESLHAQVAATKECSVGSETACKVQVLLATLDSTAVHAAQVNALFQGRCDKGDLVGCAMLGADLVDGNGTPVDQVKGTELLRRACAGHVVEACAKLGTIGAH